MLLGLVYATSGSISVLGEPVPRHASRVLPEIGALIEEPAAYPHLSGRANLRLLDAAGPHGSRRTRRRRVDDALEQVGLAGIDRRPVRAYSLGMRQRLGLAAALVRRPRLLILDEPTNGLDPRGIRDIRDLLIGLNDVGRDHLPVQPPAARRFPRCAPGSGCSTPAPWCCKISSRHCRSRPAASWSLPMIRNGRWRLWTASSNTGTGRTWWSGPPIRRS